jgi:LysR family glycine cleavage system transcriptional activator
MRYRLPPLPALRAFEASARHLSFKRAAAELFVTPAAVSQQIKVLEAYLGVSLFRRAPGELGLTEAGRAMLPRVREGLDALAAAVTLVQAPPENGLTVHAPPSFAQRWLVPRLSRFAAKHPDVALRLASDVCNIDGPGAWAGRCAGQSAGCRQRRCDSLWQGVYPVSAAISCSSPSMCWYAAPISWGVAGR